jgi:hypothetical protein
MPDSKPPSDREARLKAALRDNLKRRKAAARKPPPSPIPAKQPDDTMD